jgi:hypothetical protein
MTNLVNYKKRKNDILFKKLEHDDSLFISSPQNYIPLYDTIFSLNEKNITNINLNNEWYIMDADADDSKNAVVNNSNTIIKCILKNSITDKERREIVFFKVVPLLDPFKYLVGKYTNIPEHMLCTLPSVQSNTHCHQKMMEKNNSAYIDGFFCFLTSKLFHQYGFKNGIDYYGSFLAIKNNLVINVYDDIDYLNSSDFFLKNKNHLYYIDDYQCEPPEDEDMVKLPPIRISQNVSLKSVVSINNDLFDSVFETTSPLATQPDLNTSETGLQDITETADMLNISSEKYSIRSIDSCSSKSSHTDDDCCASVMSNDEEFDDDDDDDDATDSNDGGTSTRDDVDNDNASWETTSSSSGDEILNVTIPKFPVQIIAMENCNDTLDNFIQENDDDIPDEELLSCFMQIIMSLITYQKVFHFTHNDLHTNNVMYTHTNEKFIYYKYNKTVYRVPTYGRIFKIIDFGRAIYKLNGKTYCSDSFKTGGDAATQYNCEPYFNDKKPRLDPNYSFDLCRLACSIFDYFVEDITEIKHLQKIKDPVKKIVMEWCTDDNGLNVLYKLDGTDRYPDFKLYKMIARRVHNHTPQAQLSRPEFKKYSEFKLDKNKPIQNIIDIDAIPVLA